MITHAFHTLSFEYLEEAYVFFVNLKKMEV